MSKPNRRGILKAAAVGATALSTGELPSRGATADPPEKKANILLIISDQLGLDAIGAHGCKDVRTPNLDRLIAGGTTFLESHSTSPVCSPARGSIMTGLMPAETGVVANGVPIHKSRPNLGQWFGARGYETIYCGKWHLPGGYQPNVPGFHTLPAGRAQGDLSDTAVSHACEAYLHNRPKDKPYLMVASFMQPHDICYWGNVRQRRMPKGLPFPQLRDQLPKLPPNNKSRPKAPKWLESRRVDDYSDEQWRYYLYIYARMVEMLDADVGRLLQAVEDSGQADNTVIVFTSDHGDGRGRHKHVSKWYAYDEAMKVPLVVSCPRRIAKRVDRTHLVSGIDIMPTLCDYAGIEKPKPCTGKSLKPLLEGRDAKWRSHLVADFGPAGHIVRTGQYKYTTYKGDPVEQLFDMQADPWEMKNLCDNAEYAPVMAAHRKLLAEFQAGLNRVEPAKRPVRRRPRPNRG